MRMDIYRYVFNESISMLEAEATLQAALIAAEGVFGAARVRRRAAYSVNPAKRILVFDGRGRVGRCILRIFAAYLKHEYGADAFTVGNVRVRAACEMAA